MADNTRGILSENERNAAVRRCRIRCFRLKIRPDTIVVMR